MPGFDGTGPMGAGPMTGGARGNCNRGETAYVGPTFRSGGIRALGPYGRGFRRGFGPGRGFGRYWARGFGAYAPAYSLTAEEELDVLKQQADSVKATLDAINKRISELG
ncbi:MAG: DUF5320 domain-containing protein [Desulfobacterales bacterium]